MDAERIMIVDDDRVFLDEIEEMLSLVGYDVIGVGDSARAVAEVNKIRPDLILLDLRMKGKSGFEVARELKQSQLTANIPIVGMSGYFPIDKEGALLDKSFMSASLKKPFALADLISQLENILENRGEAHNA